MHAAVIPQSPSMQWLEKIEQELNAKLERCVWAVLTLYAGIWIGTVMQNGLSVFGAASDTIIAFVLGMGFILIGGSHAIPGIARRLAPLEKMERAFLGEARQRLDQTVAIRETRLNVDAGVFKSTGDTFLAFCEGRDGARSTLVLVRQRLDGRTLVTEARMDGWELASTDTLLALTA